MSQRKLTTGSLLLSVALFGCGGEDSLSSAPPVDTLPELEAVVSTSADCDPHGVIVGAGGPRVSRTAPITVRHGEAPQDFQVWVSGPDGKHAGELYPHEGKSVFLPTQPYPADATLQWNVRMCGEVLSGDFRTGGLLRPVPSAAFDEGVVGGRYAIDLRIGQWSEPFTHLGERVVYALGGAFLLDVVAREHGVIRIAVTAAHPDNAGGYTRLDDTPAKVFELPWDDNPYAFLELDGLTLGTSRGEVKLREALIGVGFDKQGVAEAFVRAELELSDEGCLLLGEAGVRCEPCANGDASCASVSVEKLYGLPL